MMRVFVVQDRKRTEGGVRVPAFDLSPAARFGRIVTLLADSAQPNEASAVVLRRELKDYSASHDFLLLVGNPTLIGWAVAIATFNSGGDVRVLQWDGLTRTYTPIQMPLFYC